MGTVAASLRFGKILSGGMCRHPLLILTSNPLERRFPL
jgi:hypothetical protein